YAGGVEVALCFGWIDGQRATSPADGWFRQRFTPRTAKSPWSKINRDKVEALAAAGRMAPAGVAAVDAAKADGRWERAYAGQATMEVPADLQAALDAEPTAASFFATLKGANRYAVLYRIQDAKRPETRARRIATFVAMLAKGETLH
ncbi:MAG: YdeI/OmpD-associated family protein, partial [Actinomycetota bacterium]|nr:YdeI/OmpD-associated family protein [Actinomycetota bacterium]